MGSSKPRIVVSSLLAGFLFAGSLTFALLYGVPRWSNAFQGALAPVITAYGGWPVSTGIVMLALITAGVCGALSWKRETFDYLIPALGVFSVLAFVSLGMPAPIIVQIKDALSLVVVGLCGLMVFGIFYFALRDRLTRRRRGRSHPEGPAAGANSG